MKSRFCLTKSSFRKFVLPLLVLSTTVASAAVLSMSDVNEKVSLLLAPYNTSASKVDVWFTSLEVDDTKTVKLGVSGLVSKVSQTNSLDLDIKDVTYAYGDGTKPTVNVDVAMKLDLVTAFGQKMINEFADILGEIAVSLGTDFMEGYGDALTISAGKPDVTRDANGDVEQVSLVLSAEADLSKLPAEKPITSAEFQSVGLNVTADRNGLTLQVQVVVNPLYKGFSRDEVGMKEYIEKLLADDQEIYGELSRYLAAFDTATTWLVSSKELLGR